MLALPGPAEARAGVLRSLEFFGAERLPDGSLRVPFGLGAAAEWKVLAEDAPLATLQEAAAACITQAAAQGLSREEMALVQRFTSRKQPGRGAPLSGVLLFRYSASRVWASQV